MEGEGHRIILNNWQSAQLMGRASRLLRRAPGLLGEVDFTPAALRADLAGARNAPRYLMSAAEMIDVAAEFTSRGAALEGDNERHWRIFHDRVEAVRRHGDETLRDKEMNRTATSG